MPNRPQIIAATRLWLGTPYHHQASLRGVGTDCLGLIRGLYRDFYGEEPESTPAYSRDWAEASGTEPLLSAARRHLIEIDPQAAQPADVLVFRWRRSSAAKHVAILSAPDRMIHAQSRDRVREVTMNTWWRRRMVAGFTSPSCTP